ncbi:prepilin-type N-terminal cleavage/methylation domain-containing protein [Psychrobacter sp. 1Y11]|uniref:prepilin-type N-terminal cleavage/methylation domain-containing protein n=1 Tax=Psychrobacter sp. 1Y11 TaxID=3457446 RepID=UPI003FD65D6C
MLNKQLKTGFTLIEMMVIVVIISIVAAIAIPIYRQHIQKAQQDSCLAEAKAYSNDVFYVLNNQNNGKPSRPVISACESITNAKEWTTLTQQKIEAIAKSPSNARIECDVPNGSPCRVLP